MTRLRQRMLEDMQPRGLSARTQGAYVLTVRQLAEHFHRSPDQITEEELRNSGSTFSTWPTRSGSPARRRRSPCVAAASSSRTRCSGRRQRPLRATRAADVGAPPRPLAYPSIPRVALRRAAAPRRASGHRVAHRARESEQSAKCVRAGLSRSGISEAGVGAHAAPLVRDASA